MIQDQAYNIVIFGAKGDLASRKLLPALYQLEKLNQLHHETRIIGVGRANWNKDFYSKIVKTALKKYNNEINNTVWEKLCSRLIFCNLNFDHILDYIRLKKILNQNTTIYYFAVPTNVLNSIFEGLSQYKLNNISSRIIIEKPLGKSFKTSQIINAAISKYFNENQVFRIDHYLGKETVLNLLALRFANSIFSMNWNSTTIDHMQITVSEKVGIEGRWSYFDQAGQIRDMLQNHLLQILSLITMNVPVDLKSYSIQKEKIKILQALRPINDLNINKNIVIGQYIHGILDGIKVPAYINEKDSNKNSNTETFVCAKVNIDNFQWKGVPFYLRTGKRLPMKYSEIIIAFKKPLINIFSDQFKKLLSNQLIIRLQPNEGISLQILNKQPSLNSKYILNNVHLNFEYSNFFKNDNISDAYERLLLESMKGDQTLFVSRDEIEASWLWIDSIIKTLNKNKILPEFYESGTWGPKSSFDMIKKNGRMWNKFMI